jgi:hypothetical protein
MKEGYRAMVGEEIIKKVILGTMEGRFKWSILDRRALDKQIKNLDTGIHVCYSEKIKRSLIRRRRNLRKKIKKLNSENANVFGLEVEIPRRDYQDNKNFPTAILTVRIKEDKVIARVDRGDVCLDYSCDKIPSLITLSFLLRDSRNTNPEHKGEIIGAYSLTEKN